MSNCTMLTQTHVQQFNELTSSELRSSELIKVSALIFVCNLTLHTGVLAGSWITFHRLQPSSGVPGPPDGCCTLGPPGSVGGKPAASLLDASELLLFERLLTCVSCNGKARDIGLAQPCYTTRLQPLSLKQEMPNLTSVSVFNHRHDILFTSLQKLLRLLKVF